MQAHSLSLKTLRIVLTLAGIVAGTAPLPSSAQQLPDSTSGLQRHIVGGREAARFDWPWLGALIDRTSENPFDGQFCGSTLIHPWWVLTATHCLTEETADSFNVLFNVHDLANDPSSQWRRIEVAEVFLHPAYETDLDESIDGDIALIRLAEPVFDIPVIPLADSSALDVPGILATVAGWGRIADQGEASNVVREVDLPLVSLSTAQATGAYDGTLLEDMLAAGFAEGGKDSCEGDSGGPLMVPIDSPPGWAQVGVVSFGPEKGCAAEEAYGIYSRVSYYFEDLMTIIHPDFAQWIHGLEIGGFNSDPDGDGLSNYQEYALATDPLVSDRSAIFSLQREETHFVFRYSHRWNITDAVIIPETSENLREWTVIPSDQLSTKVSPTGGSSGAETSVRIALTGPDQTQAQFFRLRIKTPELLPPPIYSAGPLRYLGSLKGSEASNRRDFVLGAAPEGTEVVMQVVSTGGNLVPVLSLINDGNGEVIQQAMGSQNEPDLRLTFTPEAGIVYRARIESEIASQQGTFKFNFPALEEESSAPTFGMQIAPGQSINGVLDEDDTEDGENFWDDYELTDFTPGELVHIEVTSDSSKGGFNPLIFIFENNTEEYIAESPFENSTRATLNFRPSDSGIYYISVANLNLGEQGTYTLSVTSD